MSTAKSTSADSLGCTLDELLGTLGQSTSESMRRGLRLADEATSEPYGHRAIHDPAWNVTFETLSLFYPAYGV